MRLYTVHQNPDPLSGNDLVFVKEGFCWPAFLFPMLWPLWHRLWLVALMVLAITGVVDVITMELDWPDVMVGVLTLAVAVVYAAEANDLRRWTLRRRGWRELGVALGRNLEEAEQRFFTIHAVTSTGAVVPRGAIA
jgi:hypothetical protein